ncbi:hypothetical protein MMPV_003555 [Pyropia vietnamensis]
MGKGVPRRKPPVPAVGARQTLLSRFFGAPKAGDSTVGSGEATQVDAGVGNTGSAAVAAGSPRRASRSAPSAAASPATASPARRRRGATIAAAAPPTVDDEDDEDGSAVAAVTASDVTQSSVHSANADDVPEEVVPAKRRRTSRRISVVDNESDGDSGSNVDDADQDGRRRRRTDVESDDDWAPGGGCDAVAGDDGADDGGCDGEEEDEVIKPSRKRLRKAPAEAVVEKLDSGSSDVDVSDDERYAGNPSATVAGASTLAQYRLGAPDGDAIVRDVELSKRFARKLGRLEKDGFFAPRVQNADNAAAVAAAGSSASHVSGGTGKQAAARVKYTPLEEQVVAIKRKNPDTVLLVEVGYKFRFFGEDAETAARVLRIYSHFDHNFLTASVPVFRLAFHVRRLVAAGYRVGVVRQMETAALKKADSGSGTFRRQLTEVYSRGCLVNDSIDGINVSANGAGELPSAASYILCLWETPPPAGQNEDDAVSVSLLAVDASTGDVIYDDFVDDVLRAKLEARLAALEPVEVLLPAGSAVATGEAGHTSVAPVSGISHTTERAIKHFCSGASVRLSRLPAATFQRVLSREVETKLAAVASSTARDSEGSEAKAARSGAVAGTSATTPPPGLMACLRAVTSYLTDFRLESALVSARAYRRFEAHREMRLGADALRHFEVFTSSSSSVTASGGSNRLKGSLLGLLNRTSTAFGGRLLRHWLAHPLGDARRIRLRLDVVDALRGAVSPTAAGAIPALLAALPSLPDLERALARVFYARCSPVEFMSVITAFRGLLPRIADVKSEQAESGEPTTAPLLVEMLDRVPDVTTAVTDDVSSWLSPAAATENDYASLFLPRDEVTDQALPSTDGFGAPLSSDDLALRADLLTRVEESASSALAVASKEEGLSDHLNELRSELRQPSLQWKKVATEEFLVEIAASKAARVPASWLRVNQTKAFVRFRTPRTRDLLQQLSEERERQTAAATAAWRAYLRYFARSCPAMRSVVSFLASMDCLAALARVSLSPGYVKPVVVDGGADRPAGISARDARHPVAETCLPGGATYVPNDVTLGVDPDAERCMVITGPNMGGKSSYVRMTALLAIMTQVGCFVPASACTLCPFDAVHARLGAADDLGRGLSTFMVELAETSAILERATPRSLVVLDELGRGTSTHDGTAIAYATLQHIVHATRCVTLFVTHYPLIGGLRHEYPTAVGNYFMDFLSRDDPPCASMTPAAAPSAAIGAHGGDDAGQASPEITFLYKMTRGVATRSHGLNVARLASLPGTVLALASRKAAEIEVEMRGVTPGSPGRSNLPVAAAGGTPTHGALGGTTDSDGGDDVSAEVRGLAAALVGPDQSPRALELLQQLQLSSPA